MPRPNTGPNASTRHHFITIFGEEDDIPTAHAALQCSGLPTSDFTFATWQLEQCPDTGRRHLQGVVCTRKTARRAAVQRALGVLNAHIEPAKDLEAAITYCSKAETRVEGPFSAGERPVQGQRTDMADIRASLDTTGHVRDVSDRHFGSFVRYHRGFQAYLRTHPPPGRGHAPVVVVLWGPPRTGKTSAALDWLNASGLRWVSVRRGVHGWWFDAAYGCDALLFDEFEGDLSLPFLKELLDDKDRPLWADGKDGGGWLNPRYIFFTSNVDPREWYTKFSLPDPTAWAALSARIHTCLYFADPVAGAGPGPRNPTHGWGDAPALPQRVEDAARPDPQAAAAERDAANQAIQAFLDDPRTRDLVSPTSFRWRDVGSDAGSSAGDQREALGLSSIPDFSGSGGSADDGSAGIPPADAGSSGSQSLPGTWTPLSG